MKLFVLKNIKNLLSESEFLFINKSYARSIFLILVALEEMGRVILLEKKEKNINQYNHSVKMKLALEWYHNFTKTSDQVLRMQEYIGTINQILRSYKDNPSVLNASQNKKLNLEEINSDNFEQISSLRRVEILIECHSKLSTINEIMRPKLLYVDIDQTNNLVDLIAVMCSEDTAQIGNTPKNKGIKK